MSRRALREAERRAAEALAEKQPHPSGVVDFEAHDFSAEFAPDQGFDVGDTQDIWAALTAGQRAGEPRTGETPTTGPVASAEPRRGDSSVSGDLLDRVRDAVLRRAPDAQPSASATARPATGPQPSTPIDQIPAAFVQRPATGPQPSAPIAQVPAAFVQRPATGPQPSAPIALVPAAFLQPSAFPTEEAAPAQQPAPEASAGLTRRQRRELEAAGLREDGLPNELFADPRSATSGAVALQQPTGFEGQDYEEDGYYDEPYLPEPTVAIPRQATDVDAASPTTNPVGVPSAYGEPAGDDALTFSSPIAVTPVAQRSAWAGAEVDPAFIEPATQWAAEQQAYDPADDDEPYEQQAYAPGPMPAAPFAAPQVPSSQFQSQQLGPPSEVTDLAGFEALIRKARQQPQPAPVAPSPALAWADEEEVQEGFTGLLSRNVQGSHGSANALILPNDPQPDLTQAVSASGDIFITGSMNLPRSLSTTGAPSELFDSHEIDRLYEASQDEPAAGVAPVRASKAVSGAPHERGFGKAPRRSANVLPTVLAIVAGAMAVGVVTLLVGSWVLKLF